MDTQLEAPAPGPFREFSAICDVLQVGGLERVGLILDLPEDVAAVIWEDVATQVKQAEAERTVPA